MLAGELSSQRQSWVVRAGQHQELELVLSEYRAAANLELPHVRL